MKPDLAAAPINRIKKTRWFICLFIWWIIAVFFYLFVTTRENQMADAVIATGAQAIRQSAESAGLPLLERNAQALTRMAQRVADGEGVINVSIIDHRNKIIAFTDRDWLLPMPPASVKRIDGVSYWPHTLAGGTPVICFAADIDYSGTKIGEILMARAAVPSNLWRTVFGFSAVGSFLIIVFILLILDFHGVKPLRAAAAERIRTWLGVDDGLPDGREIVCPLCGHQKPLNRAFLLQANLNRYPVLRTTQAGNHTAQLLNATGIHLREVARRSDLGWLRLQIIHRCADIIKRLAGD